MIGGGVRVGFADAEEVLVHAGAISPGNKYGPGVLFGVDEVPGGGVGKMRASVVVVRTGLAFDALFMQQGCGKDAGVSEGAGDAVDAWEDRREVEACGAKPNNT